MTSIIKYYILLYNKTSNVGVLLFSCLKSN